MNVKPVETSELNTGDIAILGVPFDEYSSFLRGPALAPKAIREAYHSPSSNYCSESETDLGRETRLKDLGDLEITDYIKDIEEPVNRILRQGAKLISLGGDHSVTYPLLRAFAKTYKKLNVLQLDAHPDLYDEYEGNRHAHGCPFARAMEEKLAVRLVQVGIRTMNPHQRDQANRFGVEIITMNQWRPAMELTFDGPLYLSLDLDVLDPAFAPGVSHHEPGGLSTRELTGILQRIQAPLVGADIVELNPTRDNQGITAMVAAKCFKEIVENMLQCETIKKI
jgi:agmatinase